MGKSLLLSWINLIARLVHEVVNLEFQFHKCLSSELELPSKIPSHGPRRTVQSYLPKKKKAFSLLLFHFFFSSKRKKKMFSSMPCRLFNWRINPLHTCIDLSALIRPWYSFSIFFAFFAASRRSRVLLLPASFHYHWDENHTEVVHSLSSWI